MFGNGDGGGGPLAKMLENVGGFLDYWLDVRLSDTRPFCSFDALGR